jgi:hypothetical protein
MIVVLVNRPVKRVFDRDDRRVAAQGAKRGEDFFKPLAGNHFHRRTDQFHDRLVTERPRFTLEGYAKNRARFGVFCQFDPRNLSLFRIQNRIETGGPQADRTDD